LSKGGLR